MITYDLDTQYGIVTKRYNGISIWFKRMTWSSKQNRWIW